MTELLEKAVETVRRLKPTEQDMIARTMLDMAQAGVHGEIDPDHLRDVLEGLDEIARGEIATAGEVESAFRHFER